MISRQCNKMLKQLTIVFALFVVGAMTQNQTSSLTVIIAKQVSIIVNRTANSNTTMVPSSMSALAACGLDVGCIVTNLLTLLLFDPLIYGLRGLLVVIVFTVRFLLLVVQFILNIILGLVMGLLQSSLSNLNLGNTSPQLISTLKSVQPLLSQLLQEVGDALQSLTKLPLASQGR